MLRSKGVWRSADNHFTQNRAARPTARLPCLQNISFISISQPFRKKACLCSFSATINTFEGNEHSIPPLQLLIITQNTSVSYKQPQEKSLDTVVRIAFICKIIRNRKFISIYKVEYRIIGIFFYSINIANFQTSSAPIQLVADSFHTNH